MQELKGAPPRDDRAGAVVRGVALISLTAQAAAMLLGGGWIWGADAYAFLPRGLFWLGLAGTAALLFWVMRRAPRAPFAAPPSNPLQRGAASWLGPGAVLIGAGLAFWGFRIRHVLLGDGIAITNLLPDSREIHPREPLGSVILRAFYDVLQPHFARPGVPKAAVVQACIAAASVVAGILFVAAAAILARELVRCFPAREPENGSRLARALVLVLLAQGYVQLFFGYVENYAFPVVAATLYLAASLRFLRGAGPLWVPLGCAALGVALDFALVVLGPSALVLAGAGLLDATRRRAVGRDLLLTSAVAALLVAWLQRGPLHYSVVSNLAAMLASGRAGADYLFSVPHLRDFLNEHLLIGPFGLLLFVPIAALAIGMRSRLRAEGVFLLVAGLSAAAACWSTPDLPMGYARDWDLFGPLAVVLTTAAIATTLALLPEGGPRWRAVTVVVVVSLFHTVPWIALNASELRSLERFKTLPLGHGRTENTVAFWYAQHGDLPEAKRWLKRSLAADPGNNRALDLYGRIAFDERNPRLALQAYLIAVTLRPDKADYRRQLALAVEQTGGPLAGLRLLDTLMAGNQENGGLWLERAMLLRAAGRDAEAAEAKVRALRLSPGLASAADTLPLATEFK